MNPKPKVLMLGWEYPPVLAGGLGVACYGLVQALNRYADIELLLPRAERESIDGSVKIRGMNYFGLEEGRELVEVPLKPLEEFARIRRMHVRMPSPYPVGIGFEKEAVALRSPEAIRALYSGNEPYGPNIMQKVATYSEVAIGMAKESEFDLIHAHDWITFPAAIRLKELTGKPLVIHIHSLETDRIGQAARGDWNSVYEVEKKAMKKADHIVTVSRYTRDCAVREYGIPESRIRTVHNAINPEEGFRLPNRSGEKLVLFLGRVTFQKGPEFMVESAWKLLQVFPDVLFFVAGVGDMLNQLKALVLERKIDQKFVFAGFLSQANVKRVLAQADVYFMPSVSEPFGLSALEAAQFDVPCVISNQSGVKEVLPNALHADFWDTGKFANYLYGLLNYKGIREEMKERTREDLNEISWDESAKDVMEIYNDLLGNRQG